MAAPAWTAEGAAEVAATMRTAADHLRDLSKANRQAAELVAERARQIAPILTGALRGSIVGDGTADEAGVSSNLIYGPVIHNGWPAHNISPNPFIRDAFTETQPEWERLYQQALQDAADGVHGI